MLDMTEALRPSELFALRWRSFDNQNALELTETVYRRQLWPFRKTPGSLTKVHLPDGLASELSRWKLECKRASSKKTSPDTFIFPNADGGFMDTDNYRYRILKPLAEKLGIPKLNFQVLRRTMATQAQKMGSVKDIQAHLRHSRPDTTANEYILLPTFQSYNQVGDGLAVRDRPSFPSCSSRRKDFDPSTPAGPISGPMRNTTLGD